MLDGYLILFYFHRAFGVVLRVTLVFLILHITGFLTYQNPWPQELLPANETIARIFALTPIMSSSCDNLTDIRYVYFNSDLGSDYYLNPVVLMLCYYCISITSSLLMRPRVSINHKGKGINRFGFSLTRQD